MRDHDGRLTFTPRLPPALRRLSFGLGFKGRWIRVEVTHDQARYRLRSGPPLQTSHHGQPMTVTTEEESVLPIPDAPARPRPSQPPGREPARRRAPLRWVAPSASVPSVSSPNPPEGATP
jgi:alpha,alpha-trehalose phosphorylase